MNPVMRKAALLAASLLALATTPGAGAAPAKPKPAATKANWNGQVRVTPNGSYTLGNPNAPVKVTEFVSYTCPHCAKLHQESDAVLRTTVIPKGQVSLTVTSYVRNPIDMTVAMLTTCGDPKYFFARHNAFMSTQDAWMAKLRASTEAQRERWSQGDYATRMKALANDLGFFTKMESFGMSRTQAEQCFANGKQMKVLEAQLEQATDLGVQGTPSFMINGKLQDGHTWAELSQEISAALAETTAGNV